MRILLYLVLSRAVGHAEGLPFVEAYEILAEPEPRYTDVVEALDLTFNSPDPNVRSAGKWVFDGIIAMPTD